jgi:hypothetical protein
MIREVLAPESWLRRNAAPMAVASALGFSLGAIVASEPPGKRASVAPSLADITSGKYGALTVQDSTTLGGASYRAPEGFAADNGFTVDLPPLASDEVLAWDGSKWAARKVDDSITLADQGLWTDSTTLGAWSSTTLPTNDVMNYEACITMLGATGCTPAKAPETDVTLTISNRQYARIQIPADYHCTKAKSGWECVREEQ